MKRSSLHVAIGLAVTAFLTLGPVSAQARTDDGAQGPAVHAPLAMSLAAADSTPAKSKDDCKRDCDDRHGDKKDKDRDKKDKDRDRDKKDHDSDKRHGDGDHHDGDHHDGDHHDGHHDGDRCDDSEGLVTGLLCLLFG